MRDDLPLVGRRPYLTFFAERLRGREGGVLLLAGEAGVGKTRLIKAWLEQAAAAGYRTSLGRCSGRPRVPDLEPWRDAGLPAGDPERVAEQLTEQPTVLALDSFHWAAGPAIDLLRHVAARLRASRSLIVVAYRTEALHRGHLLHGHLPALHRDGAETLPLDRLTEAEVEELARAAGQGETAADLFARSGGNPFFACALLAGGSTQIQQAVDERLHGLSGDGVDLLRMAAVFGDEFAYDHLTALTGWPEERVLPCLEQAMALAVLAETEHGFRFRHRLVRETLYTELIGPRRTRLHALAAGIVGDLGASAYHLAEARAADAAVPALQEAGRLALGSGAYAAAFAHLERALKLAAAPAPAELLLLAGAAARYAAEEQAGPLFRAAREAGGDEVVAALADQQLAWLACAEGDARAPRLMDQAHKALAACWGAPRLAPLQALLHGRPSQSRGAMDGLACVYLLSGRPDTARDLLTEVLDEAGPVPGEFDQLILAEAALLGGDGDGACGFWRLSVADALARRNYPAALYRLAIWLEHLVIDRGTDRAEIERVAAQLQELVPDARRSGLPGMGARGPLHALWYASGDWESVRREQPAAALPGAWRAYYERWQMRVDGVKARGLAPGAPPRFGEYRHAMSTMTALALGCLCAGDAATARAWLSTVDEWHAGPRPSRYNHLQNLIGWAAYWRMAGAPEQARAAALAACDPAFPTSVQLPALLLLCELDPERAGAHGAAARAIAERSGQPHLLAAIAPTAPAAAPPAHPGLTRRELEIAALVAEGLTDKQIGARLVISPRTVDGHLRNIFTKLDLTSRAGLVAWAARNQLLPPT